MLWLHHQLGGMVKKQQYQHRSRHPWNIRRTFPSPQTSVEDFSKNQVREQTAKQLPYVCKWSLELLRAQTVSVTGDLRTYLDRYSPLFGERQARCNPHPSGDLCDGIYLEHCRRFNRMVGVEEQSAHDITCSGFCQRLAWDERSYRQNMHACAVDREHRSR